MTHRIYYSEPFLREFTADVTDIREASRANGKQLWQLAMDRTAFYPTSGGQPSDLGTVEAQAPSGATLSAAITAVEEDEHGEVWHTTEKPLLAGTTIRGVIDWERRFDHMQQHTGQHLLSAVFLREVRAATVSFHLGEESCTIDLALDTLSPGEAEHLEQVANRLIAENRAVSIETVAREDADALLASGVLRKLPERAGDIRLIRIADLDLNACGGTHVASTGQIGGLLIRKMEKVKGGTRVEFVCGLRAVASARKDHIYLTQAGALLSVAAQEVPASILKLQDENRAAAKAQVKLLHALGELTAAELARSFRAEAAPGNQPRAFERHFTAAESVYDAAYIKLLAQKFTAAAPEAVAIFTFAPEDGAPVSVILARGEQRTLDAGATLKQQLPACGGRGGGQQTIAQGSVPAANLNAFLAGLRASLESQPFAI